MLLRRLLLLLLHLLLLHLLLALLEFLQNLLRGSGATGRSLWLHGRAAVDQLRLRGRLVVDFRLVRHILVLHVLGSPIVDSSIIVAAGFAGAQDDLARGAGTLISDHEHVVSRSMQKLRQNIACLAGPIFAEDTLVGGKAFHFRSGGG
jgi:hypothetical protein